MDFTFIYALSKLPRKNKINRNKTPKSYRFGNFCIIITTSNLF